MSQSNQTKTIKIRLVKSNQIIELNKSNQGMVLIKLNQDVQLRLMSKWSIIKDVMTLNRDSQDPQSFLGTIFEA